MKFCIVVSIKDPAGLNIKDSLIRNYDFCKQNLTDNLKSSLFEEKYILQTKTDSISLVTIKDDTVYLNDIDQYIESDIFIFATRHQSEKGVHSLSIHAPGNWGKAEFGGVDGSLCIAPASYIKNGLMLLEEKAKELKKYEITVEQTHHGPLINKPCFFIEIGSNETQWKDKTSGRILADTIIELIKIKPSYKSAVFFGGGHYNREVNKILLRTDYAVGHICAKHNLELLSEELIKEAITKTYEPIEFIILDWKGLGNNKKKVISLLNKLNLRYFRSKSLYK